ncbi:unnamed protein product [Schistosoma margrebowiei]|uniref:Uncharacterized protein n=1 Tax=Schistosoma margrebowiei TaxID=48269 RepID=A0A183MZE6_9TREM|nr:unnamed protein product [Schistosoma margrebowiei]
MSNPPPLPGIGIVSHSRTATGGDVGSFTYMGSIFDEQGGSDADVKARIGKARVAFLQLKNIWNSKTTVCQLI